MQVQVWSIDRLIPYIRNARTHTEEQVAQVAASIRSSGGRIRSWSARTEMIIAGHARLLAARKLGMTEVPVIVLDHLTETQRRALVMADNRLALNAGWDEEMLRVELESLQEDGFNLDIVGFSDEEMEDLLQDPEEARDGLTDEDAVPETPETAVTVPGDVWVLGEHRLLCGDTTQMDRCGEGAGRRPCRHGLHRSAVQRELRRDMKDKREEAARSPTTIWARGSRSSCATPARTCWR